MMLSRCLSFFKRTRAEQPDPPAAPAELSLEQLHATLEERGLVLCTDGVRLLFANRRPLLDDVLVRELQRHRSVLVTTLPAAHELMGASS